LDGCPLLRGEGSRVPVTLVLALHEDGKTELSTSVPRLRNGLVSGRRGRGSRTELLSGQQVRLQFPAGASSGQLASKTGGERPAHSCKYRDSCKSDLAVDVYEEILGVELHYWLPRPLSCPKHLVGTLVLPDLLGTA
jgi:hypothetical protein